MERGLLQSVRKSFQEICTGGRNTPNCSTVHSERRSSGVTLTNLHDLLLKPVNDLFPCTLRRICSPESLGNAILAAVQHSPQATLFAFPILSIQTGNQALAASHNTYTRALHDPTQMSTHQKKRPQQEPQHRMCITTHCGVHCDWYFKRGCQPGDLPLRRTFKAQRLTRFGYQSPPRRTTCGRTSNTRENADLNADTNTKPTKIRKLILKLKLNVKAKIDMNSKTISYSY